jgi:hypothetical protein
MPKLGKNLHHIARVLSDPQFGAIGVIPPEPETTLLHYMNLKKFDSLLKTSALYLCRSDLCGDRFEGALPKIALQEEHRIEKQLLPLFKKLDAAGWQRRTDKEHWRTRIRRWTFVNRWFLSEYESDAMWKRYGGGPECIAVQTKAGTLFRYCVVVPGTYSGTHIGKVFYIDYANDGLPLANWIEPFFYKRHKFSHEHEVRIVFQDRLSHLASPEPPLTRQVFLPIDLNSVIMAIVAAPFTKDEFLESIRMRLRRVGLDPSLVRRSQLQQSPKLPKRS